MQEQVCDKTFPCLFQSLVRVRNALQKSSVFFSFFITLSQGGIPGLPLYLTSLNWNLRI